MAAEKLIVKWYGHSCFKISYKGHTMVLDPYASVPGYPNLFLDAGEVYASHTQHDDHGFFPAVRIIEEEGPSPFKLSRINCFHDTQGGKLRGLSDIMIIEADGLRIAHFGDLGHDLTPDKIKKLKNVDLALIPIGGFFTIGPDLACKLMEAIDPVITVPMHYRTGKYGFDIVAEPEEFLNLVKDRPIELSDSSEIHLTPAGAEGEGEGGTAAEPHRVVRVTFEEPELFI